MLPDASTILALHARLTALWHDQTPAAEGEGVLRLVSENHLRNFQLWHEEDIARRDDLGSERIHQAKRAIDRFNQERNNFMEQIDQAFVTALTPPAPGPACRRHTETPGMIIDRLSILALKVYHMDEQAQRADATPAHREACATKLARLCRQRDDLAQSLGELIDDVIAGRRTFSVYFQFKMYNDPSLNPQLYKTGGQPPSGI